MATHCCIKICYYHSFYNKKKPIIIKIDKLMKRGYQKISIKFILLLENIFNILVVFYK